MLDPRTARWVRLFARWLLKISTAQRCVTVVIIVDTRAEKTGLLSNAGWLGNHRDLTLDTLRTAVELLKKQPVESQ